MDPYRQKILDHYRYPRQYGKLPGATHRASRSNPLCGDEVTVAVEVERGMVADVRFTGRGCAITTAATSLLLETVVGKPVAVARRMAPPAVLKLLGTPITPARHGCALLGFEALQAALAPRTERFLVTQKPLRRTSEGFG